MSPCLGPEPDGICEPVSVDPVLQKIHDLVLSRLRDLDADVFLFGSRASGSSRPGSDVDIGIEAAGPLPTKLLSRIKESLARSQREFWKRRK